MDGFLARRRDLIIAITSVLAFGLLVSLFSNRAATVTARPAVALSSAPTTAPAATPDTHREGQLLEWEDDGTPQDFRVAGLRLTWTSRSEEGVPRPVLTIAEADGSEFEYVAVGGLSKATARFGVGRFDQSIPGPQILVTAFSGGAHCCTDIVVLAKGSDGWRTIDVDRQDGDGVQFPGDLDGDRVLEFQLADQRFLYAFAPYADSWAPPKIVVLDQATMRDVSAESRFSKVFENFAAEARKSCTQGGNGACAAFAAASARLGRLDEDWPVVLQSYDPTSDWDLPAACLQPRVEGRCPAGQEFAFATYPEALQWFLGELGYLPPVYLIAPDATGPSFDCDRAGANVERTVCGHSELARLDREMAWAYSRALALRPDRALVRKQQGDFMRDRARFSDPSDLMFAYQRRILELQSPAA